MADEKLQHERLVRGIAKGAGVVFISTIIARIVGYAIRVIIARYYGPEGYGFVSTSLALFTLAYTISLLGFSSSLTRQISYYYTTEKTGRIKSLIFSAYGISSVLSATIGVLLFLSSRTLAVDVFHNESLIIFIKYFSVGIVFFVWIYLSASVFKAFKKMTWYTLIQDVLRFSAILLAVCIAVLFHAPVTYLGASYLVAFAVVGIFGTLAAFQFTPVRHFPRQTVFGEMRGLFGFSWPLMLASIIHMFLYRIDILLIGHFMDQASVGFFNAAVPIGQLLTIIISSFSPFLLPAMTEYFAAKDMKNLSKIFSISTKWIFLLTIPAFSLMFFFPDFFLAIIFGSEYVQAASALQIVAVGFLLAASVGPTGNFLIVIGKTHLNMINNFVAVIINVLLDIILIPKLGIIGAAVGTAIAYTFLNILALAEIFWYYKIQPYTWVYLRVTILALLLGFALSQFYNPEKLWTGFIFFLLYGLLYLLGLKFTRCLNPDDEIILREFEIRYNRSLWWLKRFIR